MFQSTDGLKIGRIFFLSKQCVCAKSSSSRAGATHPFRIGFSGSCKIHRWTHSQKLFHAKIGRIFFFCRSNVFMQNKSSSSRARELSSESCKNPSMDTQSEFIPCIENFMWQRCYVGLLGVAPLEQLAMSTHSLRSVTPSIDGLKKVRLRPSDFLRIKFMHKFYA